MVNNWEEEKKKIKSLALAIRGSTREEFLADLANLEDYIYRKIYIENINEKNFQDGVRQLINSYCKENDSNTPDFILSEYLICCLDNFNSIVNKRSCWFGKGLNEENNLKGSKHER